MRRMLQLSGTGGEPKARWKFDTLQEFLAQRAKRGIQNKGTASWWVVALLAAKR